MPKREHQDWTGNEAEEAVNACQTGMSIRSAAEFYGIPKSTICDKLNGRTPMALRRGRLPNSPQNLKTALNSGSRTWPGLGMVKLEQTY